MSDDRLDSIEAFLHEKIPLTRAMGVRVERSDRDGFVLTAPLVLNYNHLGTAFGGSLSAISMVAGYGFLWQRVESRDCHIVIKESTIRYRRPLAGDIRAICESPEEAELERFLGKYARAGKAGIQLRVTIHTGDEVAVEFDGVFVALKDPE